MHLCCFPLVLLRLKLSLLSLQHGNLNAHNCTRIHILPRSILARLDFLVQQALFCTPIAGYRTNFAMQSGTSGSGPRIHPSGFPRAPVSRSRSCISLLRICRCISSSFDPHVCHRQVFHHPTSIMSWAPWPTTAGCCAPWGETSCALNSWFLSR
jgi:hypothetical protein